MLLNVIPLSETLPTVGIFPCTWTALSHPTRQSVPVGVTDLSHLYRFGLVFPFYSQLGHTHQDS